MTSEAAIKILQEEKRAFALRQDPPIEPCTNVHCKFSGCKCGKKCGCSLSHRKTLWVRDNRPGEFESCDPCAEFRAKRAAAEARGGCAADPAAASNGAQREAAGVLVRDGNGVVASEPVLIGPVEKMIRCLFPWAKSC